MAVLVDFILTMLGFRAEEPPKLPTPTTTESQRPGLAVLLYEKENEKAEQEAKKPEVKPVEMKGLSKRLSKEYEDLASLNPSLRAVIEDLNEYVNLTFKKTLTITMIGRTQVEQDYIYKDNPKYKKRKFKSPHQFWQAVDLRSRTFTKVELIQLTDYLNSKWDSSNYYKWTAKVHTVGHGMHFHIQFAKP